MKFSRVFQIACFIALPLAISGCLKTRAQLKQDPEGPKVYPNPIRKVNQGGGYVIDEIKNELTRMTGRLEDLERSSQKEKNGSLSDETFEKIKDRMEKLESNQTQILEAIEKLQGSFSTGDPIGLLQKGRKQVRSGQHKKAIQTLGLYLKAPKGKNRQEALYLRGEAFYSLKRYKKAIVDYSKFPEKYSRSKYMPKALYKIGLSFDALGMKSDAKAFYRELIDRYPRSYEAKKVRKKLSKSKKST